MGYLPLLDLAIHLVPLLSPTVVVVTIIADVAISARHEGIIHVERFTRAVFIRESDLNVVVNRVIRIDSRV